MEGAPEEGGVLWVGETGGSWAASMGAPAEGSPEEGGPPVERPQLSSMEGAHESVTFDDPEAAMGDVDLEEGPPTHGGPVRETSKGARFADILEEEEEAPGGESFGFTANRMVKILIDETPQERKEETQHGRKSVRLPNFLAEQVVEKGKARV